MNQEELRQRLVELLEEAIRYADTNHQEREEDGKYCGLMADCLIKNGVMIRERGEWVGSSWDYNGNHMKKCTNCQNFSTEYSNDFCPNCGADMRGGKDENGNDYKHCD